MASAMRLGGPLLLDPGVGDGTGCHLSVPVGESLARALRVVYGLEGVAFVDSGLRPTLFEHLTHLE